MENETTSFRRDAIKAAKDFNYGDEVIKKLKSSKSIGEINRIMRNAREEKFKNE